MVFGDTLCDDDDVYSIDDGALIDAGVCGCDAVFTPPLAPPRCCSPAAAAPCAAPMGPPIISLRATCDVFIWPAPSRFGKPWQPPPASCNFAMPDEVLQMQRGAPY